MSTTLIVPRQKDAWVCTRDEYFASPDLTDEERQKLSMSTSSDVFEDLQSLQTKHAHESKSRIASHRLDKVFSGLKKFGNALDVFANADPHGVLPLVWGSLRIVLDVGLLVVCSLLVSVSSHYCQLAIRWRNTVEMMVDFLQEIGPPLSRLHAYERLSPSSTRLQDALKAVYRQFLTLTHSMRLLFRTSKEKKCTHCPLHVLVCPAYRQLKSQFSLG